MFGRVGPWVTSALISTLFCGRNSTISSGASLGTWRNCTGRPAMVVSSRSLKVMVGAMKVDEPTWANGPRPAFMSFLSLSGKAAPKL
ncbi:hypothetical protein D3C80_552930 [compost metagenome]